MRLLPSASSSSSSFFLVTATTLSIISIISFFSFFSFFLSNNDGNAFGVEAAGGDSLSAHEDDYYGILELTDIGEDATERDIKGNWRTLSKKFHPDLKGDSTRVHYQRIQRAYEVLGDRKRRKIYDMKGLDGLKQLEEAKQRGNQPNQNDVMCQFFGNCGAGGGGGKDGRGKDIKMMMLVTLEDVYSGAQHTVKLNKQRLCKHCKGTGADSKDDFHQCGNCKGTGQVTQRVQIMPGFVQQMQQPCPHCQGKGKTIKKKCHVCKGHKVTRVEQMISVDIEQGTPENHELTFELEADQSPEQLPGDVVFTIQTAPHAVFERHGSDLRMDLKLSLGEALLGFKKEITHLDGHTVAIEERTPVQYGQKKTIKEEGLPVHNVPSEKGNLIVRYVIEFPENLTNEEKEELKKVL